MRALLFFPPQCRPFHPHLALPLLKAEAVRRGHACRVVDLNIRFYDHVFRSSTLDEAAAEAKRQLKALDAREELDASESVRLYRLATSLVRAPYLADHVEEAVRVMRGDDFYDLGRFQWARKVMEEALDLFASPFGHTDVGLSQLRMRYGTADGREILAATTDQAENPFIEILSSWVDEELATFQPDVVGISFALDEQLVPGFTVARHLRQSWGGPVLAGGSMITRLRDSLPTDPSLGSLVDQYFFYEAERQFGEWLDAHETASTTNGQHRRPAPVTVQLQATSAAPPARTNASYASLIPDFDDLPLDAYMLPDRVLPYENSRGCSYGRCLYCSHYKTYGRFIWGDPDRAAEVVDKLSKRYGCRHVYLVDEAIEPRFGVDFARALLDRNVNVRWMVFARLHRHWNEQVVQTMASAGCLRLIFGVDGATARVQRLMDKNTDLEHGKAVISACHRHGVSVQANFIVGFPGETAIEAEAAFQFVEGALDAFMGLGSTAAFAPFMLVREAGWEGMDLTPDLSKAKPLALYFPFIPTSGLTMAGAAALSSDLQTRMNARLRCSERFPLLREWAFLYRDRYGIDGTPPRDTTAPAPTSHTVWVDHDLATIAIHMQIQRNQLPVAAHEYQSVWWRLASESDLSSRRDGVTRGYQATAHFTAAAFELPLTTAVSLPTSSTQPAAISAGVN